MADRGRPPIYTPELAEDILDRLAGGESLRSICASSEEMPDIRTVMRWLRKDLVFRDQYARAREIWADSVFDECQQIADTLVEGTKTEEGVNDKGSYSKTIKGDMIEHRRLQVDTRKWAAGRMNPKKYGDRIQQDVSGSLEVTGGRAALIREAREKRQTPQPPK